MIVIDLGSISRFIDNFYMADKCDAVSAYSERIERDNVIDIRHVKLSKNDKIEL